MRDATGCSRFRPPDGSPVWMHFPAIGPSRSPGCSSPPGPVPGVWQRWPHWSSWLWHAGATLRGTLGSDLGGTSYRVHTRPRTTSWGGLRTDPNTVSAALYASERHDDSTIQWADPYNANSTQDKLSASAFSYRIPHYALCLLYKQVSDIRFQYWFWLARRERAEQRERLITNEEYFRMFTKSDDDSCERRFSDWNFNNGIVRDWWQRDLMFRNGSLRQCEVAFKFIRAFCF